MMSCALAACALPRSTEGPVHTYVLASDEPALESGLPTAASGIPGVLVVGLPQAAAGFDTPRMAYVQRSHEVNYYATSQWADSPARMVVPLLIRSMDRTGLWRAVVTTYLPLNLMPTLADSPAFSILDLVVSNTV